MTSIRTLLIDDNPELRAATRELLQAMGHTVTVATDGRQALTLAASDAFDLLVTDLFMPGPSGIEVADLLLAQAPWLAVVLMSSRGDDPELLLRLQQGDVSFLAKPFAGEDLAEAIAAARRRAAQRMTRPSPAERAARSGLAQPAPRPAARPSRRRGTLAGWQMAAAMVLVLGLGTWIRSLEMGAPALPAATGGSVERSLAIQPSAPLGTVSAVPSALAWQAVGAARRYVVQLLAVDGTVLWQAEVAAAAAEAPTAELPATAMEQLHRGVVYYWSVEALDAGGRRLARSGPVTFSIDLAEASDAPSGRSSASQQG